PVSGKPKSSRLGAGGGSPSGDPRNAHFRKTREDVPETLGSRGNTREPSGKIDGRESAAETLTPLLVPVPKPDPEALMVPGVPLSRDLRKNLEAQIESLAAESKSQQLEKDGIQRELRTIYDKIEGEKLLGRTQTDEYQALLARREVLKEQQNQLEVRELNIEKLNKKLDLEALLDVSERGYFQGLTGASRRQREYVAVATGEIDTEFFFAVQGRETEVDHLHPRIEIWHTPGFKENLTRDQQVFLFAYPENLKRVAWQLNSARGIKRYNSLQSRAWSN